MLRQRAGNCDLETFPSAVSLISFVVDNIPKEMMEQLDLEVLAAIDQPPAGRRGTRQPLHVPCTPAAEGPRATGRNETESIAEPALGALQVDDGEGDLVQLL